MAQNNLSAKANGNQPISDPLQNCIIGMIAAMKADFGNKFKSQFADPEELRQYKRRLYTMLKGQQVEDIQKAYNGYAMAGNEWPPTVPQLLSELTQVQKQKVRSLMEERKHLDTIGLPKPTRDCDPLAMLANAKASMNKDARTPEQRAHDMQEALLRLNAAVACVPIPQADENHLCCYPGCRKAGALTSSVRGSEYWYCSGHFQP